jgi:hypothetical protein
MSHRNNVVPYNFVADTKVFNSKNRRTNIPTMDLCKGGYFFTLYYWSKYRMRRRWEDSIVTGITE